MTTAVLAAKGPGTIPAEALRVIASGELEAAPAQEILSWAVKNFHPQLALSASFGGPEGMVLLHMMSEIEASSRVFVIDTGRLPQETYDLIDRVRDRFGRNVEVLFPDAADVAEMVEDEPCAKMLVECGVKYGQGYLFGRPTFNLGAKEIERPGLGVGTPRPRARTARTEQQGPLGASVKPRPLTTAARNGLGQ